MSAAPAREIDLDNGRLTPELIELIGRTFRGVHLLAYLKCEELAAKGKEDAFKRAVEAAALAQAKTGGVSESRRNRPSSARRERPRTAFGATVW